MILILPITLPCIRSPASHPPPIASLSSMGSSPDQRCKRNAGSWRCTQVASPGKSYCEKHLAQMKSYGQKQRVKEKEGEEVEKYRNSSSRKRKHATVGSESECEVSDSALIRKSVQPRQLKLSASSKKKMSDCQRVNNSVKSLLKLNSGEERGRYYFSPEKPSMVTVGLKEILLI